MLVSLMNAWIPVAFILTVIAGALAAFVALNFRAKRIRVISARIARAQDRAREFRRCIKRSKARIAQFRRLTADLAGRSAGN